MGHRRVIFGPRELEADGGKSKFGVFLALGDHRSSVTVWQIRDTPRRSSSKILRPRSVIWNSKDTRRLEEENDKAVAGLHLRAETAPQAVPARFLSHLCHGATHSLSSLLHFQAEGEITCHIALRTTIRTTKIGRLFSDLGKTFTIIQSVLHEVIESVCRVPRSICLKEKHQPQTTRFSCKP